MSIRAKVMTALFLVLVLFISVTVYNNLRFRQANAQLALVNELFLPFSRLAVQLQTSIFSVSDEMRRFYFSDTQTEPDQAFSRMVKDLYPYMVHKRFSALERLLERRSHLELTQMVGNAKRLFNSLAQSDSKNTFDTRLSELKRQLQAMTKLVDEESQKVTLAAQSEGRETLVSSLMMSGVVLAVGLLAFIMSGRVLQPLPQLINSIRKIADGDFNQNLKVSASSKDEVTILAKEYNKMLLALGERDEQIQKQQSELVKAERLAAVGQLSAEVVHEIRNPLNSMSLNVDWLESELESSANSEIKTTLRSVAREIERLHQITERYLLRAKLNVPTNEVTGVQAVLQELVQFSKEEDKSRKIRIETKWLDDDFYVNADRSTLKQAFLNLLKNAREAMPQGGVIQISAIAKNNAFEVCIADTGHGMNETTRKKTFTPFYTTKANGTGLGLSLTKNLIEEMHGTISCESEVGRGTTFRIQFPA